MLKFKAIERMWIVDVVQNSSRVCSDNLMLSMVLLVSLGFNYTSHRLWRLYLQCVSDYLFEMSKTSSYKMRNLWETCLIFRRRNEHLGNLALMPYLLSKGIHHHYSVYYLYPLYSELGLKYSSKLCLLGFLANNLNLTHLKSIAMWMNHV